MNVTQWSYKLRLCNELTQENFVIEQLLSLYCITATFYLWINLTTCSVMRLSCFIKLYLEKVSGTVFLLQSYCKVDW